MESAVERILTNADYFVLLLFRVSGLIISSPIFGRGIIPARVKIALTAALAYLFFTAAPIPVSAIEYSSLIGFFIVLAKELLLGIALAFVTNMFFSLVFVSGQMIDMQIGLGMANVYDPQNATQIPMLGNLLNVILLIVFFGVDGHMRLIELIYLTLDKLPVGSLVITPAVGTAAVEVFTRSFTLGVMVAMPVIASGMILELAFGVLVRTVPQVNVFVVGVPVKTLVGFVILMISIPAFINFSSNIFSGIWESLDRVFSTFAAG
ncbi:MAG: flagellar biosynthetic protein FliR [Oscillospiraceae bacterium]|jgi:flagellar biosynthetic protein FliR|nr:flagellar biosynthetic protein FliR [Oscillospiraceae bacterium]